MYKIAQVTVKTFKEHVAHLLELNHEEVHKEDYKLDVNWEAYQGLEDVGYLLALVLMKEETPIGYSITLAYPSLHSSDLAEATLDTIYIHPEHRNYKAFRTLVKETEKRVFEAGADHILISSHVKHPIKKLLEKQGYFILEEIYKKGRSSV